MTIIKCSQCETVYQEDEINIVECLECKTDEYLATHEEIEIKSCDNCNHDFNSDLEEVHTQCNKIICNSCFITSNTEYKIKNEVQQ